MFDQVDQRLDDWVQRVLGPIAVTFEPPLPARDGKGVSCYLLAVVGNPPLRGNRRPPLQAALQYLVTTWAERPQEAHRLLGELAFAALETTDFVLEPEPPPMATWQALGLLPKPSLMLRVPVRRARAEPETPLVVEPLVVRQAPMIPLHGVVVGPGNVPVAGARIELPALGRYAVTDRRGCFMFEAIPFLTEGVELAVSARGRHQVVRVTGATSEIEPFVVQFEFSDS